MGSARFIAPRKLAEKPAASLAMVANGTTEFCHPNSVRKGKEEEDQGYDNLAMV